MRTQLAFQLGHGPTSPSDLLLRETNHRCGNDFQLIVGLLELQSMRMKSEEARGALRDAAERVAVLARARASIAQQSTPNLENAIGQVCDALRPHAELRSIEVFLKVDQSPSGLAVERVTPVALVVNELMTNAIKHAFQESIGGRITITIGRSAGGDVTVFVDDDGLPYPDPSTLKGGGLGLGLAKRLMASVDGLLITPIGPAKVFELRVPVNDQRVPA